MFGVATGAWARVLAYPLELQGSLNLLSNLLSSNFSVVVERLRDLIQSRETMILLVLTLVGFTHTLMLYVLGLAALRCRGDCRSILLLLVVTGAYLLVIPGAGGQARFRIPIEPILAVFAGVGVYYLQE
jgi:ABC-type branched-subunit amino acid transport system permease subunit